MPPLAASSSSATASASCPREPLPTTSASSSWSPSAWAPCWRSFSRGRSSSDRRRIMRVARHRACNGRILYRMSRSRRAGCASLVAWSLLFVWGCSGDPPDTEIRRAQTAIDQARAAGAERYARDEFVAAEDSLKQAHDAVTDRDYRLALTRALDSRD